MRLYKAKVSYDVVFVSESGFADPNIKHYIKSEVHNIEVPSNQISIITEEKQIPYGWENALPYGYDLMDNEKTCKEIQMIVEKEEKLRDAQRQKNFWSAQVFKMEKELETL